MRRFRTLTFAAACLTLFATTAAAEDTWRVLDDLGKAYAMDAGVAYGGLKHEPGIRVTAANASSLRSEITAGLTVGYAPGAGRFEAIPWSAVAGVSTVTTGNNRTPEQVVSASVVVGREVVPRTWTLAGNDVKGYVVLDSAGRIVFDTLLNLPPLTIPIGDSPSP